MGPKKVILGELPEGFQQIILCIPVAPYPGEQESNLLIGFHLINCLLGSANVQCFRNRILASPSKPMVKASIESHEMLLHFRFQKYCDHGVKENMLKSLWRGICIYPIKIMEMLFCPAFSFFFFFLALYSMHFIKVLSSRRLGLAFPLLGFTHPF